MSSYICKPCKEEREVSGVTIKFVDGKVQHGVKCKCGKHMTLKNPKKGVPNFRSNRFGQVF